ncbi:hypothetical protein G6O67_002427 [Ophiocordyceps sinensis]|uniref:Uncharacterized protein n=1 Tax=Ophiocordyceps sinensis TaxID=72228 RepID=A0A8H4PU82_9HYPO|nr:hypothetical protein G6O67_002427 [Ophiocordyceps sinensis]
MSDERGIRTRHREIEADAVLEPVQKSRTSAKQGHSQTLLKARAASKARNGLPPSKGGKTSSRQDRGADRLPARSQSAKIQLTQGTRKRREREVPSARPLPGGETWRAASKTTSGAALEADDGRVTSALPCTWGRQDGPIPNLEEEWEKTARLAANTKAPPASQGPDPSVQRKKRHVSRYDPNHIGICCRSSRGIPSRAVAPPNIPRRTSSIRRSVASDEADAEDRDIADRDVLRGLHVAASAACDEEVDAFVRGRTGLRIRRFLADLIALEAFGGLRPGEDGGQRTQRRRSEMRKLKQQVRRSREMAPAGGGFF